MQRSPELALQPDPSRYTLPRFLDDVVERYGDRCAIRFEGESLTYADLRREVRVVARGLAAAGVVKGARVAVMMGNRPQWMVATFAAATVGAVVVPVNTFASADERDYILRHGDASFLLLQSSLLKHAFLDDLLADHPELAEAEPGAIRCRALPQLRRVFCLDTTGTSATAGNIETWATLEALGGSVPEALIDETAAEVTPADDALIIYTSGTTSLPKGVLHLQRAPVIQSWRFAELMELTADDRVWTAQPFFWSAGMAMSLGATLAAGACLVLQETFDAGAALGCIETERATAVHAWPHQEKSMAEHPGAAERDLSSVRRIEYSSPLAPLVGLKADEWGTYGAYGLSETFTIASSLPASAPAELRRDTSGKALAGTELRIVDPETGEALPTGRPGEIAVKGLTFMRGYYKVAPEMYLDDAGYFRTQDGGSLDADGYLHWTGRLSNLIKTGGANVAPAEIEDALVRYPGMKAAVAIGVPHPTLGEAIVLCAVPVADAKLDVDEVRSYLRGKLSAYKVPRLVLVFAEAEVSYTGNQKLQVEPLREAALERLAREGTEIDGHRYDG